MSAVLHAAAEDDELSEVGRVASGAAQVRKHAQGEDTAQTVSQDDASTQKGGVKRAGETREESGRGLVLLPVVVSDPLLGWGFGSAGIYTFQIGGDADTRASSVSGSALYTTKRQLRIIVGHNLVLPGDAVVMQGTAWLKVFGEGYWGIGNATPEGDRRNLRYKSLEYIGRFNVAMRFPHWFVGPLLRINVTWDTSLEAPFPPPTLAGDALESFMLLGVGLSLVHDSRDVLINPRRGWYMALELTDLPASLTNTLGVIEATFDLRGYWKPFTAWDQVLAARAYGIFTGGDVPFSMLPSPGRVDRLRGHLEGRWRDYHMAGLELEYRIRWWGPLGTTVFYNQGMLFGAPGDVITWRTMPKSIGAGLRFMVQQADRVNLRVDMGYDFNGNVRFIFEAGEAF